MHAAKSDSAPVTRIIGDNLLGLVELSSAGSNHHRVTLGTGSTWVAHANPSCTSTIEGLTFPYHERITRSIDDVGHSHVAVAPKYACVQCCIGDVAVASNAGIVTEPNQCTRRIGSPGGRET